MHRTESDNFIVVGGLNQFTDGPPGTTVNAVDLNTLFEEICYVITQNGLSVLTVSTETNQQLYAAISAQIAASAAANPLLSVDFEAKDLLINVAGVSTVTVTAKRLSVLNSSFIPAFLDDLDTTFDIATDLMAGTSEKASTWYQLWIDSLGARLMVPDLEGTADTNTLNSLEDSTANFITDKVSVGDIVYNMTDFTIGYVGSIIAADELGIVDADGVDLDLFPDGNEDYKIHMLSPTGLGSYKANIGLAFNDSGSDLTDSGYTRPELQTVQKYTPVSEFTVTATGMVSYDGYANLEQTMGFGMTPVWEFETSLNMGFGASAASVDITVTGVTFLKTLACLAWASSSGTILRAYTNAGAATFTVVATSSIADRIAFVRTILTSKPAWATRS